MKKYAFKECHNPVTTVLHTRYTEKASLFPSLVSLENTKKDPEMLFLAVLSCSSICNDSVHDRPFMLLVEPPTFYSVWMCHFSTVHVFLGFVLPFLSS